MHLKALSIISSQLKRELNLRLIHCFGSGGKSAPIRRTVCDLATWPTTVHLGHIEFTAMSPYPRTVRASLVDGPLAHLRCVSRAQSLVATSHPRPHPSARPSITWEPSPSSLSLIHSPHLLSQAPSHGGAPPSSPTFEAPPPRRSTTGGRRRTTLTSCTTPIFIFFLGEELPQRVPLPLHLLLQASSKEDDPELLQAFPDDLKPLPVSYSTPMSVSPPRSIPHCPRIEGKKFT